MLSNNLMQVNTVFDIIDICVRNPAICWTGTFARMSFRNKIFF